MVNGDVAPLCTYAVEPQPLAPASTVGTPVVGPPPLLGRRLAGMSCVGMVFKHKINVGREPCKGKTETEGCCSVPMCLNLPTRNVSVSNHCYITTYPSSPAAAGGAAVGDEGQGPGPSGAGG